SSPQIICQQLPVFIIVFARTTATLTIANIVIKTEWKEQWEFDIRAYLIGREIDQPKSTTNITWTTRCTTTRMPPTTYRMQPIHHYPTKGVHANDSSSKMPAD